MATPTGDPRRSLREIAADITADWPQPYFGAVPYLDAMRHLDQITDSFGADDAKGIVVRFLVNASRWRGPQARRIKAELQTMLR